MDGEILEKFITALARLESEGDEDEIVALFADDCEIGNVSLDTTLRGKQGARRFWADYRKTFGQLRSEFRSKIVGESTAALEWTTTGTAANGKSITYDGVSILDYKGSLIQRFYAYFNPSRLGAQISEDAYAKNA